jgi:cytochrome c
MKMKKKLLTLSALFAIVTLIACGGGENKTEKKEEPAPASTEVKTPELSDNPVYQKGLQLIGKSDCLTCHKVDEKLIGPAYRDVANKYENTEANIKMLGEKVVKGGSGVWGTVPMAAHSQISQADAEDIVKYIMLLKNK